MVMTLAAAPATDISADSAEATKIRELFTEAKAQGAAVLLDVETRRTIAAVGVGRDPTKPVLPLSIIKLYVATIWWDNSVEGDLTDPRHGRVSMYETLVNGWDAPAAEAALQLRRKLGAEYVLARLHALGLGASPDSLTLTPDTDDSAWESALSIGESHMTVTLAQVAQFLGAVAQRTDFTGTRLRMAMIDTVKHGSASGVAPRLLGLEWQLGGKTGTGPADAKPRYDGWFAGLIFERHKPHYAICVYVPGRGLGGGVAAEIAADLTRWFAQKS